MAVKFYTLVILCIFHACFARELLNEKKPISISYPHPDGEIVLMMGDWYKQNQYETINVNVDPGKTYRIQVHNVGISTSLKFRIHNHNLLLIVSEGCHIANYTEFDIHVGQSYSFLVSMDQDESMDYYIVASASFVKLQGVAILHYSNSKGHTSNPLANSSNDQPRTVRQNTCASEASLRPQGSHQYNPFSLSYYASSYTLSTNPPNVPPNIPQQESAKSTFLEEFWKFSLSVFASVVANVLCCFGAMVVSPFKGYFRMLWNKYRDMPALLHDAALLVHDHATFYEATQQFRIIISRQNQGETGLYWGLLDQTEIVVNHLALTDNVPEVDHRINLHLRIKHECLARVIGYNSGILRELVYKYEDQKSLQHILDHTGTEELRRRMTWHMRLQIASDIIRGLHYIHYGCSPINVHGSLRTTNILVNRDMKIKLTGFFQVVANSEVARQQQKNDIREFGNILLALIVGQDDRRNIVHDWVLSRQPDEVFAALIDRNLSYSDMRNVLDIALMAKSCINNSPTSPTLQTIQRQILHTIFLEKNCVEFFISR